MLDPEQVLPCDLDELRHAHRVQLAASAAPREGVLEPEHQVEQAGHGELDGAREGEGEREVRVGAAATLSEVDVVRAVESAHYEQVDTRKRAEGLRRAILLNDRQSLEGDGREANVLVETVSFAAGQADRLEVLHELL